MKIIKIKDKEFIVDDEDFDWLNDLRWSITKNYAYLSNGKARHQNRRIYLHRLIMLAEFGYDKVWDYDYNVDHIDRNPFNCQKYNLRLVNKQQNTWNRNKQKRNHGYIGVQHQKSYYKGKTKKYPNKWTALINSKYLGSFNNPIDAAKAYDKECLKLRGKYAVLNFPN
jgi:hypothetical protein